MKLFLELGRSYACGLGEVDLVYRHHVRIHKREGVFQHHIRAFGERKDYYAFMGAQWEISWADNISHILNEEKIYFLQVQLPESLFDQVGVEVAFLAGVYLQNLCPRCLYTLCIYGCSSIAG